MEAFSWEYYCPKEHQERQEEWIPGGQLAGSATPDLGTPTSQAGQNGLSQLNLNGGSHSDSSKGLGKTGVCSAEAYFVHYRMRPVGGAGGAKEEAAQVSRSNQIPYPQGVEAQILPKPSLPSL